MATVIEIDYARLERVVLNHMIQGDPPCRCATMGNACPLHCAVCLSIDPDIIECTDYREIGPEPLLLPAAGG